MAAAAALLATLAAAQTAVRPDIHGRVVEIGSNRPVASADVSVRVTTISAPPQTPSAGAPTAGETPEPVQSTRTLHAQSDAQGGFDIQLDAFQPGQFNMAYDVSVEKDGIAAKIVDLGDHASPRGMFAPSQTSSRELHFAWGRPGEFTGSVVDDETSEPLTNFLFYLHRITYQHGARTLEQAHSVRTATDGSFDLTGLLPGEYVALIGPDLMDGVLRDFTEADLEQQDQDYALAYWPGGYGLDAASPAILPSGGAVNLGTLRARKTAYPRILLKVDGRDCEDGQTMTVYVGTSGTSVVGLPCGEDVLLRGLTPGPNTVTVIAGNRPESRISGTAELFVTGANQEAQVALTRGLDVSGRVSVADGVMFPKIPVGAMVQLRSLDESLLDNTLGKLEADGRFQIPNASPGRHVVSIGNLPRGYYAQEVRYNGAPVRGPLELNSGSVTQNLEIVLDNQPAALTGAVAEPDGEAAVTLVRWPSADVFANAKTTTAKPDGSFQFTNLAPGEYRAVAVSWQDRAQVERPGVLERLLANAPTITLARGASQTVRLDLTPAR